MKRLFLLLFSVLIAVNCYADDIVISETRLDVAKWKIDTVKFLIIDKTCEVTYRKVDINGNIVNGEVLVIFKNSEFASLISAINNGNNIKRTISNAVKIKLGI